MGFSWILSMLHVIVHMCVRAAERREGADGEAGEGDHRSGEMSPES